MGSDIITSSVIPIWLFTDTYIQL